MENRLSIAAILDQFIEKNIAFASWYNPQESKLGLVVGDASDVKFLEHSDQLNGATGFVFAPYQMSAENPAILLQPKVYFENFNGQESLSPDSFEPFEKSGKDYLTKVLSKEDYQNLIEETVNTIKDGVLSKVIISRQIPVKRMDTSLGIMLHQLHEQTPNAFCYLVNLPSAGTWMGATPEVLIKSSGDKFETVSLAGTQVRKYRVEDYYWSTKDIEEQAFVSRYMLDVFFKFDIHQYKTTGPETLESGKVAHLKTSFFFPAEKIAGSLGSFIAELHPTPAVCGLPKNLASEYIQTHEIYERRYYTGYLGPWLLDGQVSLFVNLRCMEITPEELVLYAGGGITSRSVPEKEWDETSQKAKTLLSVIQPEFE